ncbi:MAG TPA: riboflavin biosynthesis protein RibF [Prolixibacteraceae bacterium]|nr:riboflavin biosynthesis protein RibF [Prolixibacteraceae bacterium]
MRVYKDLKNISVSKPVVTIGTFDGVHLGHHNVLDKLKEIAVETGGESVVFTFYPHPRQVLTPDEQNLRLLTTLDEKIELLSKAGIDHLIVYPFTLDFARLSYSEFVKSVLVDQIRTSTLVVGYDHRFGKNREGSYDDLKRCADLYGFDIIKLDVLLANEVSISSTRIRNALESGDIRQATRYLGYHYTLHGRVVEGQQLGRTIGFPTANIESSDVHKLIPGYGVYAVFALVDGARYRGMMNIGTRPTFNNNADNRSIEVNLFDFEGHIYGSAITLVFVDKIRDERKFPDKEALVMQLHLDRQESNRILDNEM